MNIALTPEQTDVVKLAIERGRISNAEHAMEQAMAMWVERERRLAELLDSLAAADASLSQGEGMPLTRLNTETLAQDVIERHRHQFTTGQTNAD